MVVTTLVFKLRIILVLPNTYYCYYHLNNSIYLDKQSKLKKPTGARADVNE